MKTIGEERVRVDFNPSNDATVHVLKERTAHLINLVDEVARDPQAPDELVRLCAVAMERYEDACHWAVKAATFIK